MSKKILVKAAWNWIVDRSANKTNALRIDAPIIETSQENQRDMEIRKRVNAAYDAQEQQVNMMALVPHHCDDPISCKKQNCWSFIPDKIKKKQDIVVRSPKGSYKMVGGKPVATSELQSVLEEVELELEQQLEKD